MVLKQGIFVGTAVGVNIITSEEDSHSEREDDIKNLQVLELLKQESLLVKTGIRKTSTRSYLSTATYWTKELTLLTTLEQCHKMFSLQDDYIEEKIAS